MIRHCLLAATLVGGSAGVLPAQSIERRPDGAVHVVPVKIDDSLKNPVSPEYEAEFWNRANAILRSITRNADGGWKNPGGNTYFENEKRSYPAAMFAIIAGNEGPGYALLQGEDDQANGDNRHTLGIDLFPAFTIKGQIRKYFFFGPGLRPEYRERMKKAFDIWTRTDPRSTPHPIYQKFNPEIKDGWGPNKFGNRQVDSRNTDNLRAMRDIAIYLAAEESGNQATMEAVKKDILFYVSTLYSVGMGEWDSDTYHCHTVAPYLSLYDFAKDPEMKKAAKAALDHLFTSAAIKYYNGTFAGPSKRDYGGGYKAMPASSFGKFFALYFGQTDRLEGATEPDLAHAMTSNYRPPPAVIALASKKLDQPIELLATKPVYENWKEGQRDRPGYFETVYMGKTFQLGSLISPRADGDTGPFRLVVSNSSRNADVININSRPKFNEKFAGDQVGQYRNLLVWLRPTDKANPFAFLVPKNAKIEQANGVSFIPAERSWLAIRPINLQAVGTGNPDAKAAEDLAKKYPDSQLLTAAAGEGAYSGFALEVGEEPLSFDEFKKQVLAKGKLDISALAQGRVRLTGVDGSYVELTHTAASDLPTLDRNGIGRNWSDPASFDLWKCVGGPEVVSLGWKKGTLKVSAGGSTFESTMAPDGKATSSNR